MKKLLFLLPLLAFAACKKDDTGEVCSTGCTVIEGTVTTSGAVPVSGVKVEVRSVRDPKGIPKIRRIAEATTDAAGHYRLQFALTDYEAGPGASAATYLRYDYDENRYLPLGAGNTEVVLSAPWLSTRPFENREVTLTRDIYLPLKAGVALQLSGWNPPVNYYDNFFQVTAYGKAGVDGYWLALYQTTATANPTNDQMLLPGGDSVRFELERRSTGNQLTKRDTTIWIPVGGTSLQFSF
jgi:hypothetical protein